ncbi:MAG: UDP-N-acetylmuramoyl-L-alanine--D-glutamate ligase [Proteobacteria bacterium]|nr:UDP-N-acetylmuramoyl-L-alanine--D-glutamate ligase [Pseudomonadota bacterium]
MGKNFIFKMTIDFNNKKFLVLGAGLTGVSIARYLVTKKAFVSMVDDYQTVIQLKKLINDTSNINFIGKKTDDIAVEKYDYLALSPGVPLSHSLVTKAQKFSVPLISDIDIFFNNTSFFAKSVLVGITGSNGKTTVANMIGSICMAAGKSYLLAGNIGRPVLDVLRHMESSKVAVPSIVVLELSSFQLDLMKTTLLQIAVILNMTEDHLDRYKSFDDYVYSKLHIFKGVSKNIINRSCLKFMPCTKKKCTTFGIDQASRNNDWRLSDTTDHGVIFHGKKKLMSIKRLNVLGFHNVENAMASAAVCDLIDIDFKKIAIGLQAFIGLPHRLALVREINAIKFIDDSKGTNVGAVVAALSDYQGTAIPILGGDGKGQDFTPLRIAVSVSCRAVILIGRDKAIIATVLEGLKIPIVLADSMEDAVNGAFKKAKRGDSVILSPGCASFDMFKDYKERAQYFINSVNFLAESL